MEGKRLRDLSERAQGPDVQAGLDALERAGIAEALTDRERAMAMFWSAGLQMILRDFSTNEGMARAVEALTIAALVIVSEEELDHVIDAADTALAVLRGSG